MSTVLIKICGVTTPEDAAMVAAAGADAIGVNLWPGSKRHVTPDAARDILAAIPAGVLKVGVFVDAPADEVERQIDALGLDRAQLHGDEAAAPFGRLDSRAGARRSRARRIVVRTRGRLVARALAL